jgi:SPP1 family predicted phage head-tail adaptor
MIECGKYDRRVTIQQATKTRDSIGGEVLTWTTYKTWWCRIRVTGGGEKYVNQQTISEATHQLEGRFIGGVKPTMRVLYGSRIFNILLAQDFDERHETLKLYCKELV